MTASDLVHDTSPHTQVVSGVSGEYACCGCGTRHRQIASAVRLDGVCKHLIAHASSDRHKTQFIVQSRDVSRTQMVLQHESKSLSNDMIYLI